MVLNHDSAPRINSHFETLFQQLSKNESKFLADLNLSSTELESGNAIGAFLQTPAPVLDKISGPMGARFLSSTGLGSGNLTGRAQFPQHPHWIKISLPVSPARKALLESPNRASLSQDSHDSVAEEHAAPLASLCLC